MVGRTSERYDRLTTAGQGQNGEEVPNLVVFLQKVLLPVLIQRNKKKNENIKKKNIMSLTCPCRSSRPCRKFSKGKINI